MCVQVCTHACARNTHMQIHVCVTPGVLVQMHTCVLFFCLRVTTLWEMFVWWKKIDQQPDTINLKLLSFEITDVASPGIVCNLRVKCPLLEILLLICSSPSALLCVTGLLCLSVISGWNFPLPLCVLSVAENCAPSATLDLEPVDSICWASAEREICLVLSQVKEAPSS